MYTDWLLILPFLWKCILGVVLCWRRHSGSRSRWCPCISVISYLWTFRWSTILCCYGSNESIVSPFCRLENWGLERSKGPITTKWGSQSLTSTAFFWLHYVGECETTDVGARVLVWICALLISKENNSELQVGQKQVESQATNFLS